MRETGKFSVYSGLNHVKIDEKITMNAYFVTYVSTSWRKNVCKAFMKGTGQKKAEGMIIEFDARFKELVACCDVSWISKFPDEFEILFARSTDESHDEWGGTRENFSCEVLDECKGIQYNSGTRISVDAIPTDTSSVFNLNVHSNIPCFCSLQFIS